MAKVPLAKHNDMIQAIPPDRADKSFRISVLPWRSRAVRPVTNAHRMKATDEDVAVNGVAVTDDVPWRCGPTIGLCELACDPLGRWVCGNSQPPGFGGDRVAISAIHRAIGKRWSEPRTDPSMRCRQRDYARNVLHPWDGGRLCFAMYLATVVCPTSMPSLRSSP